MGYDSNCNGCPYNQQRHLIATQRTTRTSPPVELEDHNSSTLLVFQSPGDAEWEAGKPLQPTIKVGGSAGRRIEMSWERRNRKRAEFDIINAVQCFPGNEGGRDVAPDAMAICSCSKRFENILNTKTYEKIIVFGDISKQVITALSYKLKLSARIIPAKHPNGGVSKTELDNLWESC
ncbi:uracil-DNA glycosylase superfamily protein [Geobacter sulfurreducens]|uniref:uracil-DNA glycosylase superfamily protein n=1 Tax=Geobacter sulfurreducens TaxID=35554 RepID=UPI0001E3426F|nr:uracil-DNA glycosylase superfamily protein [Geobacter sulfurreducens]ADN78383.1 uracil-DNA glycosylase superfamily protein [Geobacter sulfurreducens KN400]